MSLADELESEKQVLRRSPIDEWLAEWFATLDAEDKAAWTTWVNDQRQSPAAMFRVLQKRGYPYSDSGFEKWARRQRDAR